MTVLKKVSADNIHITKVHLCKLTKMSLDWAWSSNAEGSSRLWGGICHAAETRGQSNRSEKVNKKGFNKSQTKVWAVGNALKKNGVKLVPEY